MEKKDGTRNETRPGKGLTRINSNLLIFLFFLLLSFIFWYLNSLSKELNTKISYPISFTNIPSGKTLTRNLQNRVDLVLKGHGYSLLRLKITSKRNPLTIDLSEVGYYQNQAKLSGDYFIITTPLINSFNNQIMSECKIMSVKPDTLLFSMK